jgi:hypothetical protein
MKCLLSIFAALLLTFAANFAHAQSTVTLYEFYNTTLKQYFRTASAAEAQGIDAGAAGAGWSRTGDNFMAWQSGQSAQGLADVCRFYGSVTPGPNSHFFTASTAECAQLKALQASTPASTPRWNYEGMAFMARLPEGGNCPAGSAAVFRSYNQGASKGIDSNHRFTTQQSEYDKLNAAGWVGEGVVMCACDSASNTDCPKANPTNENTSFKRIMAQVMTPKCASCHSASSPYSAQSGLLLEGPNVYASLINATSKNAEAVAHGIKRVKPGDADESFLYTKLMQWDPSRAHQFGAPMPLGGVSLSIGQLEFIKRWINEGASETSDTIPPALLADQTLPNYAPFTALAPPSVGFQVKIDPFTIQPNFERELFVYRAIGNAAPVYVNRIDTRMRTNSHHFVMYGFDANTPSFAKPVPNQVRDLRDPAGNLVLTTALSMAYHVYVAGSMTANSTYVFPDGVALEMPANAALDLNTHYVNKTATEIVGEAYANFGTVDRASVTHVAQTLNLNNTDIVLPPNQRTTLSKTFTFTGKRTVFMLSSHMHKLGEKFVIRIAGGPRNGEVVYETTDWSHPAVKTFDTPIVLEAGQGLTSEITYNNTTTKQVSFGLTSEDEMGIIFGYYY